MKKLFFLSAILFSISCFGQENEKLQHYAIKSGHVEYKLSGSSVGTRSLWWDDYGNKTYELTKATTTVKMFGISSTEEEHKITITVDDQYWIVNLIDNTGVKGTNTYYDESKEYAEELTEEEAEQLEEEMLTALNGERLPNETFMGYDCEVISVMGVKNWMYKAVSLKTEGSIMGVAISEVATEFEKNIKVPASKFTPPSDITYEEAPDMSSADYSSMNNDDEIEIEDDNDSEATLLDYKYNDFLEAIATFDYNKYKKVMVRNDDNQYTATFTRAIVNNLTITALSSADKDEKIADGAEKFTHEGYTCYFGTGATGLGTAIAVDLPKHNMSVVFVALPALAKSQLLEAFDSMTF